MIVVTCTCGVKHVVQEYVSQVYCPECCTCLVVEECVVEYPEYDDTYESMKCD